MRTLHLLELLAEAFGCHMHHCQCLAVPVELAANGFFLPVHSSWRSRDFSMADVCDCVIECFSCNFSSN